MMRMGTTVSMEKTLDTTVGGRFSGSRNMCCGTNNNPIKTCPTTYHGMPYNNCNKLNYTVDVFHERASSRYIFSVHISNYCTTLFKFVLGFF